MALSAISATCPNCGNQFRQFPKRTFLAFQKMKCPNCSKEVLYPLTSGYRTTYWIISLLLLTIVVVNLANGQVTYPGLLGFAAVYALVEDARIRKAIAARSVA